MNAVREILGGKARILFILIYLGFSSIIYASEDNEFETRISTEWQGDRANFSVEVNILNHGIEEELYSLDDIMKLAADKSFTELTQYMKDEELADAAKYLYAMKLVASGSVSEDAEKAYNIFADLSKLEDWKNDITEYYYLILGYYFYSGIYGQRNLEKAAFWYQKAWKAGNNEAEKMLGVMYINGEGYKEDEMNGVKLIREAAVLGDQESMDLAQNLNDTAVLIALNYQEKEIAEAVRCTRMAAILGNINAQYVLFQLYYEGQSVTKDMEEAFYWCKETVENQHPLLAGNDLTRLFITDNDKMLKNIQVQAQYSLGVLYLNGFGVKQDIDKGLFWLQTSAENGQRDALLGLATVYINGEYNQNPDPIKAFNLIRLLAEQGDPQGQYNLGICYYQGIGTDQDKGEAVPWFQKAAEQGWVDAMKILAYMYYNGDGVPVDKAKALEWSNKAEE